MLEFVTKAQYWTLLDQGIGGKLKKARFPWHLKSVQDAMARHYLGDPEQKSIAEIGGGDSRILPGLSRRNRCTNIEKFEGDDGGPAHIIRFRRVRNVRAYVGEFSDSLNAEEFDTLVSVSVVEHLPNDALPDFIRDSHRILAPGGEMLHLVDMYLNADRVHYNRSRIAAYLSAFDDGLFEPVRQPRVTAQCDLRFDESYCSNPDDMMYGWSDVNPDLRPLRERAQCVTLAWRGRKV